MNARDARQILEVLEPGLLTTVQDGGRPGFGSLGVPEGGAADRRSLAVANLFLGNRADAPALECTLVGPRLRVLEAVTVALAGADLGARIDETGERVAPGTARPLDPGWTLTLPGPADGGARAYVAVPGGIVVPTVLGSAATLVGAGLGGIEGRALRAGDVIMAAATGGGAADKAAYWPGATTRRAGPAGTATELRITAGPHGIGPEDPRLDALTATTWTVDPRSDRMGVRFDGPPLPGTWTGELATIGVLPGAIQVPPDGRPIALLVDAQPTGGYQVPAVVIRADLPALGQVGPGDAVRFVLVSPASARAALRAAHDELHDVAEHLREGARWDDLWRSARG